MDGWGWMDVCMDRCMWMDRLDGLMDRDRIMDGWGWMDGWMMDGSVWMDG